VKVAISASGSTMESEMDPRFGRAAYFIFIDSEAEEWSAEKNAAADAAGGAGRAAGQMVAAKGASAVVSGNIGPNALQSLHAANIKVYQASVGSVADVFRRWKSGLLQEVR
jgi:predicted Fe-Mo cluster-binding NifX family protein